MSRYEKWLKSEGDTFQSTLYEKIMAELMTLGGCFFVVHAAVCLRLFCVPISVLLLLVATDDEFRHLN